MQPLLSIGRLSRAVASAARRWYVMKEPLLSVGGISVLLLIGGTALAWSNDARPPTASLVCAVVGLLGLTVAESLWRLSRRVAQLEKQSEVGARDRARPT
jgi:hypothetical protein